jgi:hypothetical protein
MTTASNPCFIIDSSRHSNLSFRESASDPSDDALLQSQEIYQFDLY